MHLSLEEFVDDTASLFSGVSAELFMQVVEEAGEKVGGIALFVDFELVFGGGGDLLEKLVRGNVALEGSWVPYLAGDETELFYQFGSRVEIFEDEKVSQGRDVSQQLDDDVHVIVCFEIIYPHESGEISFVCESIFGFIIFVEFRDLLFCERGVDDVLDVVECSRLDFVVFGQDVYF